MSSPLFAIDGCVVSRSKEQLALGECNINARLSYHIPLAPRTSIPVVDDDV